ncbi:MAG: acyltransferase family protein, partial [Prevotellaceae bacterium]|nr:acyltransferase family protein [Prevotellaceae bacterium]
MSEQTKRIEALDIAKGIGIILVIIGHMSSSYLRDWIYSFHMPLFFIISGICFKTEKYPSFL